MELSQRIKEATHARFSPMGFGSDRYGSCESCGKLVGGSYTLAVYGKEYNHKTDHGLISGVSRTNDCMACHECTSIMQKDANDRGLLEFKR